MTASAGAVTAKADMTAGPVVTAIPSAVLLDTLQVCPQRHLSMRGRLATSIPACLPASVMPASARAKATTAGLGCPTLISGVSSLHCTFMLCESS